MTVQDPAFFGAPDKPDEEEVEPSRLDDMDDDMDDLREEVQRLDRRIDDQGSSLSSLKDDVHEIKGKLSWATMAICATQVVIKLMDWVHTTT